MEPPTVRLIESLRRWGGAFAECPVIAVMPRRGPGLSSHTLAAFKRHDVRFVYAPTGSPYAWFRFYNKPLALALAEKQTDSEMVAWLDSDILVVREPHLLRLQDGEMFAAAPSAKEMGTTGPGDDFEPFWQAMCRTLGIDIESLPWLTAVPEGVRIRLYWNSGIFVYRRSTQFGQRFLDTCTRLMDARNRADVKGFGLGINEMGALGFVMHMMNLKWRALPVSHNYSIGSRMYARGWYRAEDLREACIVHYHDAMWPPFWDTFLQIMQPAHPDVAAWLRSLGPMRNEASLPRRLWGRALRAWRDRQERAYLKTCRPV